jgi:hypothetical protein
MPINSSRLKAIWPWLVEVRYVWYSMAVICVALIISLKLHPTEPIIRITGLALQLLGIGTVIWGISETRALFGQPSFASKIKAWLSRFPLLRHDVVLRANGAIHLHVSGKGRLHQTHKAIDPTTEARIDSLEKNIELIHERINQTQKEMDEGFQKVSDLVKREEQFRQTEDNAIRMKLEATGTGGVHISAIGASLLFVGIILSTAATEIAALFK